MKLNKTTIESLTKAIDDMSFIKKRIEEALSIETNDTEEFICQRYIGIQNVYAVAAELNDKGYKNGSRKYVGKDISQIVTNKNSEIGKVAKALFEYNNTLQNGPRSFAGLLKKLKSR